MHRLGAGRPLLLAVRRSLSRCLLSGDGGDEALAAAAAAAAALRGERGQMERAEARPSSPASLEQDVPTSGDGGHAPSTEFTEPAAAAGAAATVPLLVLSHPACLLHNLPGHFERPQRVTAILEALKQAHLLPPTAFLLDGEAAAPRATRLALERFHTKAHVDKLFALFRQSALRRETQNIDGDTAVMPGTEEAALRAAGATCVAVDRVLAKEAPAAFCVVRPPGHHATLSQAMGFCFFNNAGVAALHARAAHGLERVACVDVDVHHGNGTQELFENDPSLFYASTHMGFGQYPGTGFPEERGVADNIVNVPLKDGEGSQPFRRAYESRILPALRRFQPELLLISTGFDAHADDPLGELELSPEDFHWVTARLVAVARDCGARGVVSVLEGGYDLSALADCAVAHARALMGKGFSLEPEPEPEQGKKEEEEEEEEVIAGLAKLATRDDGGGGEEGEEKEGGKT